MKKSTIVRTILFVIVLINMGLKASGHQLIDVSESVIYEIVEYLIEISILVLSWWKNNSFTKNAQKADEYLEELKRLEEED